MSFGISVAALRVRPTTARRMLSRVPEVTIFFWTIKVLATTVGETFADYLNDNLGLGLAGTTSVMSVALIATLIAQFAARRYIPAVYWMAVVLTSVVGTLITANLTDHFGVDLAMSTLCFGTALAVTFFVWHRLEHTLSIHTIDTNRREAFYWLAVLFTFALGTAAGDWMAERLNLGYSTSLLVFAAGIGVIAVAYYRFDLDEVVAFWIAYILTLPLGASTGDLLSQPQVDGGFGLGTTATSFSFLALILAVVVGFTVQERRRGQASPAAR
jgi:uncharacterized membrane-anchored protein